MKEQHPVFILCERYPQLTLPITEGARKTDEFRAVCLRGEPLTRQPEFTRDERDSLDTVDTPAGEVSVLTLYDRKDFEHAYMALGNYCEPMNIPASTGAVTILGLNNWDKIRALTIPVSEADKSLYKDAFILLSAGPYSNVSGQIFGIGEEEWLGKSVVIRKYHELTHFISRKLYPKNQSAIRDEIMADMTGLLYAFGRYDTQMARTFLGIESPIYREGGRLQNYVREGTTLEDTIREANGYIDLFSAWLKDNPVTEPFDAVLRMEESKCGIQDQT